jgi:hypothetical protein
MQFDHTGGRIGDWSRVRARFRVFPGPRAKTATSVCDIKVDAASDSFRIVYWNHFVHRKLARALEASMPLCLRNCGGSIWLQKL